MENLHFIGHLAQTLHPTFLSPQEWDTRKTEEVGEVVGLGGEMRLNLGNFSVWVRGT